MKALRVILALMALASVAPRPCAQGIQAKEFEVKAEFLLRFAQFTEWPRDSFPSADSPFTIAVVGNDPFGPAIDRVMATATIKNRRIAVMRVRWGTDLSVFNMVFVPEGESARARDLGKSTKGRAVLIVGETPGFAKRGGLVNFYWEGSRLRFEMNNKAARSLGIQFSSNLLSLARIVE